MTRERSIVRTKKSLLKPKKGGDGGGHVTVLSSPVRVRLHNVSHVDLSKPLVVPERTLSIADHMIQYFSEHVERWERAYVIHHQITGRLLNFLFTKYAPKFPHETSFVYYNSMIDGNILFHIRHQYETLLKAYRKHNADTFRRGMLLDLVHPSDPTRVIATSVPKANLIFWMIENHVDQFVLQEQATIERAMMYYVNHDKSLDGFHPSAIKRCVDDDSVTTTTTTHIIGKVV